MRVISLNANGIRSATDKGALDWLAQQSPDMVCLQELKAQLSDLQPQHQCLATGLQGHFACAQKKGYSGVGLYGPSGAELQVGFGVTEFDDEGRLLAAHWPGLTVVSLYAPSGSANDDRQASKFRFMKAFAPIMAAWMADHAATGREYLICGDWNIAHTERDLNNWKGNLKNSGFLPEERAWLSDVFGPMGWVDVYRHLHPEATGEGYTWWSNRGQARAKNVGWRIDYQVASPGLAARAKAAWGFTDARFSDHAPLVVDYDLPSP